MKIVILVHRFPPKWLAGTEIATYNIAKFLALRGHEVHVLTSLDKGLAKRSKDEGFWVHRISFCKIGHLGLVMFWLKLLFFIRDIQPDVVHAQSIGMGIPAFLAKVFLHKPYVVWGQGSDVYGSWLFIKPISKLVMRNADGLIALTDDMSKEMHKLCNKPIKTIPNGIDLDNYEILSRDNARITLNIPLGESILCFVGTLRPVKGVKYLIEAMCLVAKNNSSIKLILVGDGPERMEIMKLTEELNLKDVIIFVGRISNVKISAYLSASDIFILPSLSEGFPMAILEAMACGLPIVTTRVRGLPEIVMEGVNGFIVDPKNPDQLASRIKFLIQDSILREEMSRNNKEMIKMYTLQNITKGLEAVYFSVLQRQNN
jgi:glycosyltransferase involved in cell wall biosynthesis